MYKAAGTTETTQHDLEDEMESANSFEIEREEVGQYFNGEYINNNSKRDTQIQQKQQKSNQQSQTQLQNQLPSKREPTITSANRKTSQPTYPSHCGSSECSFKRSELQSIIELQSEFISKLTTQAEQALKTSQNLTREKDMYKHRLELVTSELNTAQLVIAKKQTQLTSLLSIYNALQGQNQMLIAAGNSSSNIGQQQQQSQDRITIRGAQTGNTQKQSNLSGDYSNNFQQQNNNKQVQGNVQIKQGYSNGDSGAFYGKISESQKNILSKQNNEKNQNGIREDNKEYREGQVIVRESNNSTNNNGEDNNIINNHKEFTGFNSGQLRNISNCNENRMSRDFGRISKEDNSIKSNTQIKNDHNNYIMNGKDSRQNLRESTESDREISSPQQIFQDYGYFKRQFINNEGQDNNNNTERIKYQENSISDAENRMILRNSQNNGKEKLIFSRRLFEDNSESTTSQPQTTGRSPEMKDKEEIILKKNREYTRNSQINGNNNSNNTDISLNANILQQKQQQQQEQHHHNNYEQSHQLGQDKQDPSSSQEQSMFQQSPIPIQKSRPYFYQYHHQQQQQRQSTEAEDQLQRRRKQAAADGQRSCYSVSTSNNDLLNGLNKSLQQYQLNSMEQQKQQQQQQQSQMNNNFNEQIKPVRQQSNRTEQQGEQVQFNQYLSKELQKNEQEQKKYFQGLSETTQQAIGQKQQGQLKQQQQSQVQYYSSNVQTQQQQLLRKSEGGFSSFKTQTSSQSSQPQPWSNYLPFSSGQITQPSAPYLPVSKQPIQKNTSSNITSTSFQQRVQQQSSNNNSNNASSSIGNQSMNQNSTSKKYFQKYENNSQQQQQQLAFSCQSDPINNNVLSNTINDPTTQPYILSDNLQYQSETQQDNNNTNLVNGISPNQYFQKQQYPQQQRFLEYNNKIQTKIHGPSTQTGSTTKDFTSSFTSSQGQPQEQ